MRSDSCPACNFLELKLCGDVVSIQALLSNKLPTTIALGEAGVGGGVSWRYRDLLRVSDRASSSLTSQPISLLPMGRRIQSPLYFRSSHLPRFRAPCTIAVCRQGARICSGQGMRTSASPAPVHTCISKSSCMNGVQGLRVLSEEGSEVAGCNQRPASCLQQKRFLCCQQEHQLCSCACSRVNVPADLVTSCWSATSQANTSFTSPVCTECCRNMPMYSPHRPSRA